MDNPCPTTVKVPLNITDPHRGPYQHQNLNYCRYSHIAHLQHITSTFRVILLTDKTSTAKNTTFLADVNTVDRRTIITLMNFTCYNEMNIYLRQIE